MKIKKIFAGMAAAAIAASMLTMTSAVTASADDVVTGKAGITFQTDAWNFRNPITEEGSSSAGAEFPDKIVGVNGGASGNDTDAEFGDVEINGDGTYTVTMKTSGTVDEANPTDTTNGFNFDDGTTRKGYSWNIVENTTPDGTVEQTATAFNMLFVSTDIKCTFEENDDGDAIPYVNGQEVKVSDITVDICGEKFTADSAYFQSEATYLEIMLINKWADGGDYDAIDSSKAFPTAAAAVDGTITITFTISGLGDATLTTGDAGGTNNGSGTSNSTDGSSDASDGSSNGSDGSSTGSDSSSSSGSGSGSTSGSKSGSAGTSGSKSGSAGTSGSASGSTSSDDTSAEAGAPAGIALAGIAVAGATFVASKKRK